MLTRFAIALILLFNTTQVVSAAYEKPASLPEDIWQDAQPYILPPDHPIKSRLDKLFKKARVTENAASLKKAGFTSAKPGRWSKTVISKNKNVKGYYLKFCTDDQKMDAYAILKKRVVGSRNVQAAVERHNVQKWFKVPKKWLYPLPDHPAPQHSAHRKHFVLVAEDCHILAHKDNETYWHQFSNKKHLTALYTLLQEEGLLDSVYPFNIPFNRLGQICFIDLEFNQDWPIPFNKLSPYLSSEMRAHWDSLRKEK